MRCLLLLLALVGCTSTPPRYCADEPNGTGMLCAKTEAEWQAATRQQEDGSARFIFDSAITTPKLAPNALSKPVEFKLRSRRKFTRVILDGGPNAR